MSRYFESLRPRDVSALHSVPDGLFLVRVRPGAISLAQAEAVLRDPLRCPQAQASDRVSHHGSPVLHAQGSVEAELVSAGFRLRLRAAPKG